MVLSGGEPLSEELEAKIVEIMQELYRLRIGLGNARPVPEILRAFAREILQNAEFAKGCECDSCCRLEELRVKVHLPEGSADEIAGSIGHILDGQLESLQELWPLQDQLLASQDRCKSLAEALEHVYVITGNADVRRIARNGLAAYRDFTAGAKQAGCDANSLSAKPDAAGGKLGSSEAGKEKASGTIESTASEQPDGKTR